jgi:hypothetical protein
MSKEGGTKSILSGDSWGRRFFVLKVSPSLMAIVLTHHHARALIYIIIVLVRSLLTISSSLTLCLCQGFRIRSCQVCQEPTHQYGRIRNQDCVHWSASFHLRVEGVSSFPSLCLTPDQPDREFDDRRVWRLMCDTLDEMNAWTSAFNEAIAAAAT